MAQDVVINGTTYPAVETVALTDANGNTTMFYPDAVRYVEQILTEAQKAQARKNINAVSPDEVERAGSGVYILSEGETIDDAPADADVVIDPNGEADVFPEGGGTTTWEELGSSFTEGVILEQTSLLYDEEAESFLLTSEVYLTPGQEYTVTYNGLAYTGICQEMPIDGGTAYFLGNLGAMDMGELTEEPFLLMVLPSEFWGMLEGITGQLYALDGAETVEISVTGMVETITPIPEKYLPGNCLLYPGSDNLLYKTKDTSNPQNRLIYSELRTLVERGATLYLEHSAHEEGYDNAEFFRPVTSIAFTGGVGLVKLEYPTGSSSYYSNTFFVLGSIDQEMV